MKILSSEQIRRVDMETMSRVGISSLALMKQASTAFADWFMAYYSNKNISVLILSGTGNNGGDGLMVSRLLHRSGYNVYACVVENNGRYTDDCAHNLRRVKAENIPFHKIKSTGDIPDFGAYDVLIDSIFGTGISRDVSGIAADVIRCVNDSGKPIVSVDVPSGMFLDRKTTFAVHATHTITFQIPKLALYLPENAMFAGDVQIVSIGLDEVSIAEKTTHTYLTEENEIRTLLKPLPRFAHKGIQGHTLLIGGSLGKCGAVMLSSKAALKSGCGLVTAYMPKCGVTAMQSYFPEAMVVEDMGADHLVSIKYNLKPDAIGLGMGMGLHEETAQTMWQFLVNNKMPLVVDADGLNILSHHPEWLSLLPEGTILTPHPKELRRLIGDWNDDFDKIEKTRSFSLKYGVIVLIKGAYSLIVDGKDLYVNSTGTPALATAGSGDVLTGIIASLLAQRYLPLQAVRIGVFLHGLTANITEKIIHPRSFVASDIIDHIGNAYLKLQKEA